MQPTDIERLPATLAEARHAGITTDELLSLALISANLTHFDTLVSDYSDQVRSPDYYVIYEGTGDHVKALSDIIAG